MPVLVAASTGIAARGVTSGLGWNWLPGLILALVVAFLFASVISAPAARRVTGEYLILLTLAFQVIANQLMNSLTNVTGGPYGLTPIPPFNGFGHTYVQPESVFWIVLAFTVLSFLAARGIAESPFGRVLKGVREDEVAVRALGKNTVRTKIVIFGLSAAMAGLAGAVGAYYYQFIAPGNYTLDLSIFMVAVVVLGGTGNLAGTVVGAVILGSLRPILQNVPGIGDANSIPWQSVIYGFGLVPDDAFPARGDPARGGKAQLSVEAWQALLEQCWHGSCRLRRQPVRQAPRRTGRQPSRWSRSRDCRRTSAELPRLTRWTSSSIVARSRL